MGLALLINALVELGNGLLQIPQVFPVHPDEKAVMLIYLGTWSNYGSWQTTPRQ